MKKILGYFLFALLSPVVLVGATVYVLADAVVFGWNMAESFLDRFGGDE